MRTSCSASRLALCLIVLFLVPAAALWAVSPGDLVINEIDYDQPSTDTAEFLEIKNTTGGAINLGTISVLLVNGSVTAVYDTIALPAVSLPAGDYFVVCANAATVANCDLDDGPDTNFIQNGAPDAVALVEGAVIIDTVSYEGDTGAPYTEGSGAGLEDDPSQADVGISRCPDGADTNQNNADLSLQPITPGAANSCPAAVLVINEIDYDQPGTDTAEFVEIKNVGSSAASLGAYSLQLVNGNAGGAVPYQTIPLPAASLAPGDYFVVCGNSATVANCDLDVAPDTNLIQNGAPDAVALLQGALIVDTVSYEGNTGAPYTEGSGVGLEDTAAPDESISRCPDGTDTNQNNVDFSLRPITPGAANSCPVVVPPALVINEILQNPSAVSDAAGEWFEVFNPTSDPVDINGWTIKDNDFDSHLISNGGPLVVPAGGFLVLGNNDDSGTNGGVTVAYEYSGVFLGNGGDELVLLDGFSNEVDRVEWDGGPAFPDPNGASMSLRAPSLDNNVGANWCEAATPFGAGDLGTPGAKNDCPAPPLLINEVDADTPGSDALEFVELYDGGAGGTPLDGFVVVFFNGSSDTSYDAFDLDGFLTDASGYFVLGNAGVSPAPDIVFPGNGLQNGADAVALYLNDANAFPNGTGVTTDDLVDAVVYDTNDADDAGLLVLLNAAQPQLNEDGAGDKDNHSNQRCPDGFGGGRNTDGYVQAASTPGALNNCPPLEIFEIQGAGLSSPYEGFPVNTADNVVTSLAPDGFFMQTPTARTDGLVDTSDGIFVFTGGPPAVSVGDLVDVSGKVVEFFGLTELGSSPTVTVTGLGAPPPAVLLDATVPSPDPAFPSCAIEYECYESMLVEVVDGFVAGSNQEFGSDPFAEIHITAAGARPFREPGIEFPGLVGLPVWDGNPEVFELDPDKLGLPNMNISAGSLFTAKGVMGFEFNHYELWPNVLAVSPAPLPVPVRSREPGEMTIGSLNLFRLFDDVDDPPSTSSTGAVRNDALVPLAEYLRRRAKLAAYIVGVLDSPDVLAVQEAEKIEVLQALAADINALDPAVNYTAYLVEGNDVGTIDVGFMVRDRIQVSAVTQLGANELFTFDDPDSDLHDRPPLLLEGTCDGTFPIAVLNLHMRSLGGIATTRVQQKRFEQAVSVAQKVQDIQTADPGVNLVVIGDFNAFEFTDGYVDLAGIVKGDFDPLDSLVCSFNSCADLVDPDLNDQVLGIDAGERYSFIFRDTFNPVRSRGDSQVLDHAMTSSALETLVTGLEYGRGNADAAEELLERDGTEPDAGPNDLILRASDHDGLVLFVLKDEDLDGVPDADDVCLGTDIPESVPTVALGTNRFALVTDDGLFDTTPPAGKGPGASFTVGDTAGCSCEQIIEALGLGNGHRKFGCSLGAMRNWVNLVAP